MKFINLKERDLFDATGRFVRNDDYAASVPIFIS